TWVLTTEEALQSAKGRERAEALNRLGVDVIPCGSADRADHRGKIDVARLLALLAERDIDSVLVEGGGTVNASFLEAGLVDRVYAFLGPKLVGGADSRSPVEGKGVASMADAAELTNIEVERFEDDILITGRVKKGVTPCSPDS
ncbi:MAG: RibD family protein, partial [Clostridia bacterium]|nr:RibD family protein [Clostridia bacterium]